VAAFGPANPESTRARVHVRTARINKSLYDPYTNLLRATTEALSAAIGGCDRLAVEAFGFDEHLAVNVQRILKEESLIDAVADPAGGSYYVEALTDALARAGWAQFQQVEAEGGFAAALSAGSIRTRLAALRAVREAAVSWRRQTLVGVNNYPDVSEKAPATMHLPADVAGAWRLAVPRDDRVASRLQGQSLPEFQLPPATAGKPGLASADLKSGRPRLLNIFASWCVPCVAEAPVLMELKRRGVAIDAIAIRDRPEDVAAFLARHGDPFGHVGADSDSRVQISLGSSGVPESFVIDGKGIIRAQHIGPIMPQDVDTNLRAVEDAR
jgi:DsbE subfamily thiol:disulfide oxidoreductase